MTVKEKRIKTHIEKIIGEGVINGEEIDITTNKMFDYIKPLFEYANEEKKALLKKLIDQNAETNRAMLVEVVEELKTLNNG